MIERIIVLNRHRGHRLQLNLDQAGKLYINIMFPRTAVCLKPH